VLGQDAEAIMTMHAPRWHVLERGGVGMNIDADLKPPPPLGVND